MKGYINFKTFESIERILRENDLPVPEGRGQAKLDAIQRVVRESEMPDEVRRRLQNLLDLR